MDNKEKNRGIIAHDGDMVTNYHGTKCELPIFFFVGTVASSFVINEIPFLAERFDKIYIITFDDKRNEIIDSFPNIRVYQIGHKKSEIFIAMMQQLLKGKNRKENMLLGNIIKTIKKTGYNALYDVYATKALTMIQSILEKGAGCILYSYWLSRGAYCISKIRNESNIHVYYAISRAHGYDLYVERNEIEYLPYRSYIATSVDSIHFISENGMDYFRNQFCSKNAVHCNLSVSRLGTFPQHYQKQLLDKKEVVIASCSLIVPVKRLDLIILALVHIKKIISIPIKWIHIGSGDDSKKIEKLAEEVLTDTEYRFLGNVDNHEIPTLYKDYDVDFFINLSDSEGIPVSIMEAMSMGIPCIGRNVGGMKEIINDSTGLLLKEKLDRYELNRLAGFIEQRFANRAQYAELCKSSYVFWEKHYNANINYPEFMDEIIQAAQKASGVAK